jgi:glycerophosphoryl diester phosphodiesterase
MGMRLLNRAYSLTVFIVQKAIQMKKHIIIGVLLMSISIATNSCMRIGHRGACGYAPENTLLSFKKAIEFNVAMIELDVFCCASGQLVVIHDATLERTTNGQGYVESKTLAELKKLDAGDGEPIPTLAEVCDYVNRRAIINIELKGIGTASAVIALINYYVTEKGWAYTDFVVSSFNHHDILAVKEALPSLFTIALLDGIPVYLASFAHECKADAIGVSKDCITQEYIDDAHARGLKVYVFTVNSIADIQKLKNMNVDGLFSNYPDRV